jgi:hypothetical protein
MDLVLYRLYRLTPEEREEIDSVDVGGSRWRPRSSPCWRVRGRLATRWAPPRPGGAVYLAGAPLLIAHRGGAGLAPENTLRGLRARDRWWRADLLELDVQPTRDGEAVVFHDATLDRTTDGSGPVVAHTLAELRELDAGYHFRARRIGRDPFRGTGVRISTLGRCSTRSPGAVNVEIKDGRAQEGCWRAIRGPARRTGCWWRRVAAPTAPASTTTPAPSAHREEELRAFYAAFLPARAADLPPPVRRPADAGAYGGRQVLTPAWCARRTPATSPCTSGR